MNTLLPFVLAAVLSASPSLEGLWEGPVTCPPPASASEKPPQPFVLTVFITQGAEGFEGFMGSQQQGLSAQLKTVSFEEEKLRVTANVPHHYQAELQGPIEDSTWKATLTQGPVSCSALLQRDPDVQLKKLPVPPTSQSKPVWSWLSAGEMLFRHYGVLGPEDALGFPSQCTIVRALFSGNPRFECSSNCNFCKSMAGGSAHEFVGMLTDFPRKRMASGRRTPRIFAAATPVLDSSEVRRELDQGNPIVASLNPGTPSAVMEPGLNSFLPPLHLALIVGYLKTQATTWYLLNDPYPFPQISTNPYVQNQGIPIMGLRSGAPVPVAYWLREDTLKSKLRWKESFLVRAEPPAPPP
ncbi:hypothetical protein POL68_42140 [Stigmatella sp. ncwal1]|uniref:Uncharacterized protein n=1 Tax=Stigmatella ashevillensis TaxID=2995309 RepID=A0ABT5DN96_9BACT|nr:hypothetical protein [Stigmatella ashevillena]MDC0715124.1 hypothetical protein [Stigmatella ashevillena]